MTYPVFASGDVLNASDMNAVGWWLITGSSFTTATSFSLPNNTFSSTYRNYRIMVSISTLTADADFTGRLRASGSDITATNYATAQVGYTTGAAASNFTNAGVSSWSLAESDGPTCRYNCIIDLMQPQVAVETNIFTSIAYTDKTGATIVYRAGMGQYYQATQADSFSFISSVASSMTGVYRVYGYRDS